MFRGVRENEGLIEISGAEFSADVADAFGFGERNDFVDGGMRLPEVHEFRRGEQCDVGVGFGFAQAQQRGCGHHGVTQPIHATN